MRTFFFAALLVAGTLISCQGNNKQVAKMTGMAGALQDSTIIRLWPHEVDSLRKIDPNIPYIDVRTELEFRTSHMYRAINCDVNSPDFEKRIVKLGLQTPVVLYDEDSSRSLKAAEKMRLLGFKRIYEVCGGLYSMAREGKTLVSGESSIDSNTVLK